MSRATIPLTGQVTRQPQDKDWRITNADIVYPASPFAGWPTTEEYQDDNGARCFAVQLSALTPEGAKLADRLALLIAWLLAGAFMGLVVVMRNAIWWLWPLTIAIPLFIARPVLNLLLRRKQYSSTEIRLTPEFIYLLQPYGWKRYDRKLPHSFCLLEHDQAQYEKKQNEYRIRAGQCRNVAVFPQEYYSESFHVVLRYCGQRVDIMDVFGRKEAEAILARLQACNAVIDGQMRTGGGHPMRPEDEVPHQPGAIPEDV